MLMGASFFKLRSFMWVQFVMSFFVYRLCIKKKDLVVWNLSLHPTVETKYRHESGLSFVLQLCLAFQDHPAILLECVGCAWSMTWACDEDLRAVSEIIEPPVQRIIGIFVEHVTTQSYHCIVPFLGLISNLSKISSIASIMNERSIQDYLQSISMALCFWSVQWYANDFWHSIVWTM